MHLGLELENEGTSDGPRNRQPRAAWGAREASNPTQAAHAGAGGWERRCGFPVFAPHLCPAPPRLDGTESVPQGLGPECIMTATPGSVNVSDVWVGGCARPQRSVAGRLGALEVPVVLKPHSSGYLRTLLAVRLRPARLIFRPRPQARAACAVQPWPCLATALSGRRLTPIACELASMHCRDPASEFLSTKNLSTST